MRSTSSNPTTAATFVALRNDNGRDLMGTRPDNSIETQCSLSYPLAADAIDGPLFKAVSMEEKWDIYLWKNALYFARSWTGSLAYVAEIHRTDGVAQMQRVIADRGACSEDASLARNQVDFLIRNHIYGQRVPHPLPAGMENDPETIGMYSFSLFGSRGHFACFGDTSQIARDGLWPACAT